MIDNVDRLMRKFRDIAESVQAENLGHTVGNQIKLVQREARLLCPSDDGELRRSIMTKVEEIQGGISATCYTNKKYGPYVEFGTGPKGEASHEGISPDVTPAYSQRPWWIHESQIDAEIAEKYGWFRLETKEGVFYQCTGQAAQPFLYPALKDNEERVTKNMNNYIKRKIKEAVKND
ncbi:HK97-gp10 family putative phage morphogenesis protein [Murimonas intestini]|uniref:HK97-gp10 family putative phage morphogenesis protein n=1 Tax=Murimonas intestini TaxID=1337051 RepID=UPI00248B35A4|nr:HK97-gp10 family putative phage morphogenesis protein [Murimonas intestini]